MVGITSNSNKKLFFHYIEFLVTMVLEKAYLTKKTN
jgi:hypothetical protein